jgi:hypothetical protein
MADDSAGSTVNRLDPDRASGRTRSKGRRVERFDEYERQRRADECDARQWVQIMERTRGALMRPEAAPSVNRPPLDSRPQERLRYLEILIGPITPIGTSTFKS